MKSSLIFVIFLIFSNCWLFDQADPEGPEFESTFENTEQKIGVTFTSLEVLLHQEALLSVMKFAAQLQKSLQV